MYSYMVNILKIFLFEKPVPLIFLGQLSVDIG